MTAGLEASEAGPLLAEEVSGKAAGPQSLWVEEGSAWALGLHMKGTMPQYISHRSVSCGPGFSTQWKPYDLGSEVPVITKLSALRSAVGIICISKLTIAAQVHSTHLIGELLSGRWAR